VSVWLLLHRARIDIRFDLEHTNEQRGSSWWLVTRSRYLVLVVSSLGDLQCMRSSIWLG
jgi:hypothetical protein